VEIWHNPRCSKSRQALALIEERGGEPRIRRYLDDPPSAAELELALEALGMEPWDITRRGDALAKELGVAAMAHDRREWIDLLVANPSLIERPIILSGDGRAVLGRPPESVLEIIEPG